MAYADRNQSGSRLAATIFVAVILAVLGYAFVTGLAYQYVKKASEKLNTFDVEEPPPPPEEVPPPPPPPDQPMQPPPVVTPPPLVSVPTPPINVVTSVPTPPPVYIPAPVAAPPAPPAPPPPPRVSQKAGLKGNVGSYFSDDNYPPAAIRAEAQGRVAANLSVGTDGRVSACSVTSSSGNSDLDETTCRIARNRVRFTPAKDDAGNPIASTYPLAVRWVLPKD